MRVTLPPDPAFRQDVDPLGRCVAAAALGSDGVRTRGLRHRLDQVTDEAAPARLHDGIEITMIA